MALNAVLSRVQNLEAAARMTAASTALSLASAAAGSDSGSATNSTSSLGAAAASAMATAQAVSDAGVPNNASFSSGSGAIVYLSVPFVISSTPQSIGGYVAQTRTLLSQVVPPSVSGLMVNGHGHITTNNGSGPATLWVFSSAAQPIGYYVMRCVRGTALYGASQAFNCIVPMAVDSQTPSIVWQVDTQGFDGDFLFQVIGYVP